MQRFVVLQLPVTCAHFLFLFVWSKASAVPGKAQYVKRGFQRVLRRCCIVEQARKRCIELSESVTSLREEFRKANRTLDKLAEAGVELPSDNNASTSAGR